MKFVFYIIFIITVLTILAMLAEEWLEEDGISIEFFGKKP